jgi:hypothetical protein
VLTFIETRLFSKLADELLGDDGLRELQMHLMKHPDEGALIRQSGGVRKTRWALPGRGKSGGIRVIYYLRSKQGQIWLLTLYSKNVSDSIPAHVLRKIREEIEDES